MVHKLEDCKLQPASTKLDLSLGCSFTFLIKKGFYKLTAQGGVGKNQTMHKGHSPLYKEWFPFWRWVGKNRGFKLSMSNDHLGERECWSSILTVILDQNQYHRFLQQKQFQTWEKFNDQTMLDRCIRLRMEKKSTLRKRPETDFQLSEPALIEFYLPTQHTIGLVIFCEGIYSTSLHICNW